MRTIFCPRCQSTDIEAIGDGYYRCNDCGYTGLINSNKEILKK